MFDGQRSGPSSTNASLTASATRFGFLFQRAALFDSMTDRAEHRLSAAAAYEQHRPHEIARDRAARLGRSGLARQRAWQRSRPNSPAACENASDWPGPGYEPRDHALRRTDHGPRSDHERRDQRTDYPHARPAPVTSIVVTHDMRTARKVADRIVMLYPLPRLKANEPQIIYDGPPERNRRVAATAACRNSSAAKPAND